MKINNINEYFRTSDLALASAISLWYSIESIDKRDPNRAIFEFKKDEQFDELIQLYWRKELKVEPQSYFYQLKAIKTRLYSKDNG